MTIRNKAIQVLEGMKQGILERDEVLALSLLSALAGESIFLLGLPGVGKSMVARRLKLAFQDATVFEYLMSRFSTPDEIFGPVSISKLKDEDRYERVTTGFLPEAEIVFLDEIWKAGPAIQNSLLTVLNEKIYLNGNSEMHLPMKGFIGASNELPAKDEGLEALWDRFIIRVVVNPIESVRNFKLLLLQDNDTVCNSVFKPFSKDEYEIIKNGIKDVQLPDNSVDIILAIHDKLRNKMNAVDPDTGEIPEENMRYYISDRRWKKCIRILKTSAFINGRSKIDISDLLLLSHMLWNDDSTIDELKQLTAETIMSELFKKILDSYKSPKRHAIGNKANSKFYSPDGLCYLIECDGSPLMIHKSDYELIRKDSKGIFFGSETTEGHLIISDGGQFVIKFVKDGVLSINGYSYPLQRESEKELGKGFISDTENEFDTVIDRLYMDIQHNIFTSNSEVVAILKSTAGMYRTRFMQLRR